MSFLRRLRLRYLLGLCLLSAAGHAAAPVIVGSRAPALVVPQLDGQTFDLTQQHGRVVIVNFWASWCSPCRAEMPLLDSFYQRYRSRGLVLLGLSVDDTHERGAVRDIMRKFTYPAALAVDAKVNGFGPSLAVPMTFIIDASGVVRARLVAGSALTEKSLNEAVLPLLTSVPGGS